MIVKIGEDWFDSNDVAIFVRLNEVEAEAFGNALVHPGDDGRSFVSGPDEIESAELRTQLDEFTEAAEARKD